jgi:RNA polymerase primary sigma factor
VHLADATALDVIDTRPMSVVELRGGPQMSSDHTLCAPARNGELTQAAERRLVVEARNGHPDQLERLIEAFRPSIAGMARLYRSAPAISSAELMQQGVVGLLRALDRYDPGKGVPFWAYASWWVRQSMQQLVAELSRTMVLSDRALRQLARIKQAERDSGQGMGRQPSASALARETGVPATQIGSLRAAERPAVGLDERVGHDGRETVADHLADAGAEDPCDVVAARLAVEELPRLLEALTARELAVVRGRFGFDEPECTLVELGERLGVSAERVRQIEQAALAKLRERSTQCG